MHELAITRELISLIKEECKEKSISKPNKVLIHLGKMTNFNKEPILLYFDLLKKETPLIENSVLEIKELPGKLFCRSCRKKSEVEEPFMIFCPLCDSHDVELIQGKELIIKSIGV
jgi:hydrogenase nickel incorporation protein HypA/HybF